MYKILVGKDVKSIINTRELAGEHGETMSADFLLCYNLSTGICPY